LPLPSAVSEASTLPPPAACVVSLIVAPGYTVVPSDLYAVPAIAKLWQPRQSRPALWLVASDVPGAVVDVEVVVDPDGDVVGLTGELPPHPAVDMTTARARARADGGAKLFIGVLRAKPGPVSIHTGVCGGLRALSRLWHIVDAVSPALDSAPDTAAAPGGRLE